MISIEQILKKRFGGAVNIKGIDFQIVYSLYRALDLLNPDCDYNFVRFEGIEDVDLLNSEDSNIRGIQTNNNYTQIKTSDKPWNWAKLAEPFKNFAEVLKVSKNLKFTLIFNFPVRNDIQKLSNYQALNEKEKNNLIENAYRICQNYNIDKEIIKSILNNLSIISYNRNNLINEIKLKIANNYQLNSNITDFYFYSFAYQCIEWAYDRKTISKNDLDIISISVSEAFEKHKTFESIGINLISKINWEIDKNSNDFYDAKRTRAGHIVANLDVKRPFWIEKIDKAFSKNYICVIKAASGQGKSTLAYRYILENWDINFTYIIKSAQTLQEANSISEYLIYLSKLGIPVNLLIDDVKEEIKYYSEILSVCASKGIKTLVTIRIEDDYRFSKKNITDYEIITPHLDLSEAKEIFKNLTKQNKTSSKIKFPELAFEQLGSNPLLIEYIFLITKGKMLSDLLSEQIQIMQDRNEDFKIEVLRRIVFSNTAGAPVLLQKLIRTLPENYDCQKIIESIVDEFITVDDKNYVYPLHNIRTKHLCELLHGKYINPIDTAMKIISCIPKEYTNIFIRNAVNYPNFNTKEFVLQLIDYSKSKELEFWIDVTKGLYEGGEEFLFFENKHVFDKVYEEFGNLFLFNSELFPVIKTNSIDSLINTLGKLNLEKGFVRIKELTKEVKITDRGFDFVKLYLSTLKDNIDNSFVNQNIREFGSILDWLFFLNLEIPKWNEIVKDLLIFDASILDINSFCAFSQGFYRADKTNYSAWFKKYKKDIFKYLKEELKISEIEIKNNELSIRYYNTDEKDINAATVNRLKVLRSAIPFCDKYNGSEIIYDHFIKKSKADYNPSKKQIPKGNIHIETDVDKNAYLSEFTENYYRVKTWVEFQQKYFDLRVKILEAISLIIQLNEGKMSKEKFQVYLNRQLVNLEYLLKHRPDKTPADINPELEVLFKEGKDCFRSIDNTLHQLISSDIKNNFHLIRVNYSNFLEKLPKMQLLFSKLKSIYFEHFDFESLCVKEISLYNKFPENIENMIKYGTHTICDNCGLLW